MPRPDLAQSSPDLAMRPPIKPAVLTKAGSITGLLSVRCLVAADFNGDKRPDLAVSTTSDNQVRTYINSGGFMFSAASTIPVPTYPIALAVGDVNKDGMIDLGVASFQGHNHTILVGNGTGSFTAVATLLGNRAPNGIHIVDLDGDGTLDVLGVELGMGNKGTILSLFRGQGTGLFAPVKTINSGIGPAGAAVVDLNHDGRLDIVSSGYEGSTYSVSLGMSGGTFAEPKTTEAMTRPRILASADFNRDGHPDIAMTFEQPLPGYVGVYLGRGDGSLGPVLKLTAGNDPYGLGVFDANRDEIPDLYVMNMNSNEVSLLLGRGDGTFEPTRQIDLGGGGFYGAAVDFDGDGKIDLAAQAGNQIVVLRNETP